MFPDPSTSPGHYTEDLLVNIYMVTAADAEADGWIRGFPRVVYLGVVTLKGTSTSYSTDCQPQIPLRKSLHLSVLADL